MAAGSTFTTTVVPGTTWVPTDAATDSKLNLTANPTVSVTGSSRLLTDVASTAPGNGQYLAYNSTTGEYEPTTPTAVPASSGIYLYLNQHFQ